MDYIHEPVMMHYVLDSFQQLPVPHVLVVRLALEAVNHCGGREGTRKTSGSFYRVRPNCQLESNSGDAGCGTRAYLETFVLSLCHCITIHMLSITEHINQGKPSHVSMDF